MIDPADVTKECETMYAFACSASQGNLPQSGMTLRDYFAAQAMTGLLFAAQSAGWSAPNKYQNEMLAKNSYATADAMLEERSKT